MGKPILPPRYVNVPAGPVYDEDLPDGVLRTYVQLRGLAWGKERMEHVTVKEIMEVTGKSRSTIYGHLGVLRDRGWLLFNSAHYSWLTVEFSGGSGHEGDKSVDKPVDKPVDNLSRFLDSLNEEVKELKDPVNSEVNILPPVVNSVSLRAKVVQNSGQETRIPDKTGKETEPTPLPPSGEGVRNGRSRTVPYEQSQEGVRMVSHNGWHDVIKPDLEHKLERLGVFAPVYGQVAEAVRSGEWTVEQVHELADQVIGMGEKAGAGVFVYRLKNRIRPESPAERTEKELAKFRKYYREQKRKEAEHGAQG